MRWDDPVWRTRYLTRVWWPEVASVAGYAALMLGGVLLINHAFAANLGLWQWLIYLLLVVVLGYYGVAIVDAIAERWISWIMARRWQSWWQYLAQWYDLADVTVDDGGMHVSFVLREQYAPVDAVKESARLLAHFTGGEITEGAADAKRAE